MATNGTNHSKIQVTSDGLKALQEELDQLKNVRRPQVVDRVAYARDQGDLSENSDYISGKEELNFVDGRIAELEQVLSNVVVVDPAKTQSGVQIGNKVTVRIQDKDAKHEFHVVGEWEADPKQKKISHESPLGKALIGKKVGEMIEVDAPAGKIKYTIVEID